MNKVIENIKRLALACGFIAMAAMYVPINATHIVGADMTFECLGNDFYQIDLTVRRDCINGDEDADFDDPAFVGIFDAFGNPLDFLGRFGMVEMELLGIEKINPSLPECAYLGGEICVEEGRYRARVFLPFREKGYVLGYQRCCRNITLNNIVSPTLTGNTSFVCLTEPTLNSCNSMPKFDEWPEIVICSDEPFVFDHSAIDRDGDSLVYELHTPFAGATEARPKPVPPRGPQYDTIEYAAGFTLDNLLGVGEALSVDPNTGVITAVPGAVGQYLVGVLVEEWRDGKILSKTRRNFELNVRVCEDVARLGFEAPALTCDGLTVAFTNTSTKNFGYTWNFNNPSMDAAFMSNEESPTFTFPEEGVYEVSLSSTNPENDCEVSVTQEVAVYNSQLEASYDISATECNDGKQLIILDATSIEPNADLQVEEHQWEVVVGDQVIPLFGESVVTEIDCVEEITVALTSTSSNGCTDTEIATFLLDDIITVGDLIDEIADTLRICIGDETPLLNSVTEGVVYTWSPLDSLTFTDTENFSDPIANPTETTLYTVEATDGVLTDQGSVLVIVDMKPEFTFGVDSTELCRSGSTIPTIDGDASYDYQYDPSSEVNIGSPYSPNDPLFSPTGDGFFYVTVTNGACVIIDSVYVTAIGNDPIALDEAFIADPIISNNDDGTISLSVPFNFDVLNEQFDIDSVYWEIITDAETITGTGMDISAILQPASSATVNVYIVDSKGCVVKITRVIDLGDVPSIDLLDQGMTEICVGDTAILVLNPNSEWTYTWDPEDGLIFADPNDRSNPTVVVTESILYRVTVSNGTNSVTDSIFIEALTDLIDISIVSDGANICDGMAIVEAVNNTNGNNTDYQWSLDSLFTTVVAVGQNASIPITGDSATIYLRGESDGFCGSNIASLDVVNNSVDITPDFDPINTCISPNGSVNLVNNAEDQTVSIGWTPSDNITSDDLTSPMIEIQRIGDEMSIELTYTATNDKGCETTETITVPVNDDLTVEINGDTESCTTTGSFTASANAPTDSVNYEWSLTEDFAEIISTSDSVTADLGETGIIYLRANTDSGCESPVVSRMLDMKNIIIDVDAPARICPGDTADVDLLFQDGQTFDVTWEDNPAIVSELTGPKVFIAGLGGSDTITLRYTADDGNGCEVMNEIRVANSMVIDPDPTNTVICGTLDQQFSIDPIYVDGDVAWDFSGLGADPMTSTSASPLITFDSAGIYQAILISTMETCNFDTTQFFFQVPEVLEIMTDQSPDQLLCGDSILMLRATSNGNAITWTDGDGNLLAVGDSVEINAADISQVTATTLDANGCSEEIVFNIGMYMFDVAINAPTEPVCTSDGGGIDVSATDNTGANVSYEWTSASGGVLSGGDTANPTIDPANSEDLQLTVTNEDLGCSMTFDVPVSGGSLDGSISSDAEGDTIDLGEEVTISVDPRGDNISYMWDDGSTEGPDRTVMPEDDQTYTVTITDNDTGCTSVQSITITVNIPDCNSDGIWIPNAFSPNRDGENDVLFVRSNILMSMDLQILDRWGKEVYRSDNQDEGWNGTHLNTGDDLAPDTYAYCLKVTCDNGQEFLESGHITIVR